MSFVATAKSPNRQLEPAVIWRHARCRRRAFSLCAHGALDAAARSRSTATLGETEKPPQ